MAETNGTILIVDDTPANIGVLLDYLHDEGFKVLVARDGQRALKQVQHTAPDLILLDVLMPGMDGFETCRRLKADAATADIPVIFMTALSDTGDKVRGFEVGAVDYVTKPLQHEEVLARVTTHLTLRHLQRELETMNERLEQRVAERTAELEDALAEVEALKDQLQAENAYLKQEIELDHQFEDIIGKSEALKDALHQAEQVAATQATVLLLGETGTGKELVAQAIHNLSGPPGEASEARQQARPMVKVNCAALPSELIESELFGHEKGAFTGATERRKGRFELADGGTIFLDEVGDLPLELQAKLLRVLQERQFERVGSSMTLTVDVRVIATTNRDLEQAVAAREFREDLYFRLNVLPVRVPPLRERPADIAALAEHFLARQARRDGRPVKRFSAAAVRLLSEYHWPGNVRELQNICERAGVLAPDQTIGQDLIEPWLGGPARSQADPVVQTADTKTLEQIEREVILRTLDRHNGHRQRTARALGIGVRTLGLKLKKWKEHNLVAQSL
jgi:DNA-binding NtrC family response regulator